MLNRLNPSDFIKSHYNTFRKKETNEVCYIEIFFQLLTCIGFSIIHYLFLKIDDTAIGIIISSVSIVAGLMLNLMILIYTLIINKNIQPETDSNNNIFINLARDTISTIAYCVLISLILVVFTLFNLTKIDFLNNIGHFFTVFFGINLIITIMIVLKRCYALVMHKI